MGICDIIWPGIGFGDGDGRTGDCVAANCGLKFCAKAVCCINDCGALPGSEDTGDCWGNCCAAGENGCGELDATLWGTAPGRIWLAMMGDGVAFADPFGWRCGYGDGWPEPCCCGIPGWGKPWNAFCCGVSAREVGGMPGAGRGD